MTREIKKVAVLGSGVMGSGIAAHLANAGIPSYLLDIVPPNLSDEEKKVPALRNKFAAENLAKAIKNKPAVFYSKELAEMITIGNFEDDLIKLAECDWVIEVVVENLKVKQELIKKVAAIVADTTIVSSNTSGIDIDAIVKGLPAKFCKRWLGTHFFNPVRYMKLLELIPGKDTNKKVLADIAEFGRDVLGKGIIYAKNTPNFVANRIGTYGMMYTMNYMVEADYSITEVDAILGQACGRPRSAAYKTCDMVGIDTLGHVAKNVYENIGHDPKRESFLVPEFVTQLIAAGKLGNKTKGGFYTKQGKERFVLDWKSGEYVPLDKPKFDSIGKAKNIEDVAARIKSVLTAEDRAGQFAWQVSAASLIYSAEMIPEIADNLVEIDRGMRWGYNWDVGPFETWDILGVRESVARMEQDGFVVPATVKKMLADGAETFYRKGAKGIEVYDLVKGGYIGLDGDTKIILLPSLKERNKVIRHNTGASLLDMGDGVACLEFHTKMNAVDDDIVLMMNEAIDEVDKNFTGLVIGNHADQFSAGANLLLVFLTAQQKEWDKIELMVREFQKATMRLRYSNKPVVAATAGLALGGGCEIAMHADAVQAAGETYIGLVEVGVGLIPAGGGCKEMVVKLQDGIPSGLELPQLPFVMKAFRNIAMANVATSAVEAIEAGYFAKGTGVSLNRDHNLYNAKQRVLGMALAGYRKPQPKKVVWAGGGAYGALLVGADDLKKSGWASEYDIFIAQKLAKILTGGDIPENTIVTEQALLDAECEAFLSLCGEQKTQDRISHMLMNNKPLRN